MLAVLTGSIAIRADRLSALLAAAGAAAVGLLLLALGLRAARLVPWALALAGGQYAALVLLEDGTIDLAATASAAALLLSAELAYWSIGPHVASDEPSVARRRVGVVARACLASAAVGMITLSASQLSVHGSLLLDIVGVGAAVGVLALLAYLARMHAES